MLTLCISMYLVKYPYTIPFFGSKDPIPFFGSKDPISFSDLHIGMLHIGMGPGPGPGLGWWSLGGCYIDSTWHQESESWCQIDSLGSRGQILEAKKILFGSKNRILGAK